MMKTRLKLLRSIRSHTLALVQGLSQEQIDFSPPSGEWSLGESVDHLLLAEQIFRAEIAALIELATHGSLIFTKVLRIYNRLYLLPLYHFISLFLVWKGPYATK